MEHRNGKVLKRLDPMPFNTMAMAMYPAIVVSKEIYEKPEKIREFILTHEELHIDGKHNFLIDMLVKQFSRIHDIECIAVGVVELLTNTLCYMKLGYHPVGMTITKWDVESANRLTQYQFCCHKIRTMSRGRRYRMIKEVKSAWTYKDNAGKAGARKGKGSA